MISLSLPWNWSTVEMSEGGIVAKIFLRVDTWALYGAIMPREAFLPLFVYIRSANFDSLAAKSASPKLQIPSSSSFCRKEPKNREY